MRDNDAGELTVRTAKGDWPMRVFLGQKIREHLRRFIADRVTGPLFVGRTGGRLTTRQAHRRFVLWARRAGVNSGASPHTLRHTCATRTYARSRDILVVKEVLGHRSIASTLVYAAVGQARLRQAAEM